MDKEQYTEYLKDFHARLDEMFPTFETKNAMLSTFMGQSVVLVDLLANIMIAGGKLPDSVKYSMAIIAANFRAVSSRESFLSHDNLTFDVIPNETLEENSHRKMKKVIKLMYESVIQEEKQEEELKRLAESIDDRKEAL